MSDLFLVREVVNFEAPYSKIMIGHIYPGWVDGQHIELSYELLETRLDWFDVEPPTLFTQEDGDASTKSILFLEPSSDGQRLLVVLPAQEPRARITVVTNGFDELRRNLGQE